MKRDDLEKSFKELLNQFKVEESIFEEVFKQVKKHLGENISINNIEVATLKKKLDGLKSKQSILLDKNIEGVISNDLCKAKLEEIDSEVYEINQRLNSKPNESINYYSLFAYVKEILKNPGEAWEQASLTNKIKLQWFYFPHGIVFDGVQSRTTKICNLFKLKDAFSTSLSSVVTHSDLKSNTHFSQISLPSPEGAYVQSTEFWEEIKREAELLAFFKPV